MAVVPLQAIIKYHLSVRKGPCEPQKSHNGPEIHYQEHKDREIYEEGTRSNQSVYFVFMHFQNFAN